MAFIPVPNTAAVVVAYTYAQQRMINTYHIEGGSPWDLGGLTLLATTVRDWFVNFLLPRLSSDGVYLEAIATSLESVSAPQFTLSEPAPLPGGTLTAVLPGGTALVVSWRTALRGRSFRGRSYVSMLPQSALAQGRFTTAYLTLMTTSFEQLPLDIAAQGWELVVVSKFTAGAPRVTGVTTPVTGFSIDNDPDSQRRRNPGRGE